MLEIAAWLCSETSNYQHSAALTALIAVKIQCNLTRWLWRNRFMFVRMLSASILRWGRNLQKQMLAYMRVSSTVIVKIIIKCIRNASSTKNPEAR